MVYPVEMRFSRIGEWAPVQGIVRLRMSEKIIRRMVPWQCNVEHANERPFVQIANIAYRDVVIGIFRRVWIPQGEPVKQR